MPCYHPLPAWYAKRLNESGKRGVTFRLSDGWSSHPVELPCGRCVGCRLERSREWAVRCVHESKAWDVSSFVTLTYSDEQLPDRGSLRPRDFVLFMKRLRKEVPGVRFFQCGEYGEKLSRPHHHAILFNCGFSDRVLLREKFGVRLYRSAQLERLWPFGISSVGDATFESAAYVARYAMKKVTGPGAAEHYQGRVPEYLTMSRRPGIGRGFIEKFRGDVYPWDEVISRGHRMKPPRYYDKVLEDLAPSVLRGVKSRRREAAAIDPDKSGKRLVVREAVKEAAVKNLARVLED